MPQNTTCGVRMRDFFKLTCCGKERWFEENLIIMDSKNKMYETELRKWIGIGFHLGQYRESVPKQPQQ